MYRPKCSQQSNIIPINNTGSQVLRNSEEICGTYVPPCRECDEVESRKEDYSSWRDTRKKFRFQHVYRNSDSPHRAYQHFQSKKSYPPRDSLAYSSNLNGGKAGGYPENNKWRRKSFNLHNFVTSQAEVSPEPFNKKHNLKHYDSGRALSYSYDGFHNNPCSDEGNSHNKTQPGSKITVNLKLSKKMRRTAKKHLQQQKMTQDEISINLQITNNEETEDIKITAQQEGAQLSKKLNSIDISINKEQNIEINFARRAENTELLFRGRQPKFSLNKTERIRSAWQLSTEKEKRLTQHAKQLFEKFLVPTSKEKATKLSFFGKLKEVLSAKWQDSELHLFGSFANDLSIRGSSDLDVCITVPGLNNEDKKLLVFELSKHLVQNDMCNVQAILNARIPIVKFSDPDCNISCDIGVNNMLAVHNTRLIRDYSDVDTRFKQLALIIKYWAKRRMLNSPVVGTLSSYGYVLMLIHYLQQTQPPVLPNLQELISQQDNREYCSVFESGNETVKLTSDEDCPGNHEDNLICVVPRTSSTSSGARQDKPCSDIISCLQTPDCNALLRSPIANETVPSITALTTPVQPQNQQKCPKNIDGYNIEWQAGGTCSSSCNTDSIGKLLWGFFRYYAHFDYNRNIITIRTNRIVPKKEKGWLDDDLQGVMYCDSESVEPARPHLSNRRHSCPPSHHPHIDNTFYRFNNQLFKKKRNVLCIEDPFEVDFNVGRVVSEQSLVDIRYEILRAHNFMCESADLYKICEPYYL